MHQPLPEITTKNITEISNTSVYPSLTLEITLLRTEWWRGNKNTLNMVEKKEEPKKEVVKEEIVDEDVKPVKKKKVIGGHI